MIKHTIIIAEAGVNHNGDMNMAKQLIDAAVVAGVDYIKFQSFVAEKLVSPNAKKAEYQNKNIGDGDDSQFNMLKKLELSHENHIELIKYCKEKGIHFFSTAFDVDGLYYLNDLGLPLFKIPSGEVTNFPYLRAVASFGKPVILSTGMCAESDIKQATDVLTEYGLTKDKISILHCNTEYPTPMKDVNLKAMLSIKKDFGVEVGYSDHTLGIEIPIAAVAMGAVIIEKHFTLDRTLPGPDHVASLEPGELIQMVKAIRNIELAIGGNGIKEPSESELKNIAIARKSIHLNNDLPKGHIITDNDIIALRPGDGISPMEWNNVVGRKLTVDKNKFDKLLLTDII
ncbi:N,N'-diacetyllegionaminic acid synthase [compost metagenome]|uniref:N-acetylneuraminate synthase n=1 Tax=Pedobacter ghigonis TaxID=2730403 RepID=UPI000F907231|nr:N-acetylneuraminate synthase [Pedobacter ghigonis]